MVNFNNGKIYKIEPKVVHDIEEIHIGSTTKTFLSQRLVAHRSDYKRWKDNKRNKVQSFVLFDKYGVENCEINLLESVTSKSKDELLARERHYIQTLPCLNKVVVGRSPMEYYKDNRDQLIAQMKEYNANNRKSVADYQKEYRDNNCEKIAEYKKAYKEANREKVAEQNKKYRVKVKLQKANIV